MSTSANLALSWKQEVNRRVAEHMNRKTPSAAERAAVRESQPNPRNRAAQAAARVAARYANAPSYSEMLANEARAAIQAAEAASRAALEAQAVAQSVLDSLEAAASLNRTAEEAAYASEPGANREDRIEQSAFAELEVPPPYAAHSTQSAEGPSLAMRREVDPRSGALQWSGAQAYDPETYAPAIVDPATPISANLIEFPREIVATRKVRPRLAEGPLAAEEPESQLSIFEVDPSAVSVKPEPVDPATETSAAWARPEWSDIRLDAQPEEASSVDAAQHRKAPGIVLAPVGRRVLAAVIDVALVVGSVFGVALLAATKATELPGMRAAEFGLAFGLLTAGALYLAFFLSVAEITPGMWYARIRLCTFDGYMPTRAQRGARLVAMLLSVLPVGVGIGWSLFDEDRLTWHDRLSRTYLRQY